MQDFSRDYAGKRGFTFGNAIQAFLIAKTDERSLELTQFPYEVRSVLRFQKEHPELEGKAVTEYAHRLGGVTRVIYVEVADFSTRAETAVQLLRGSMTANVKVVEVAGGTSKIVYQKEGIRVNFPPKAPEGVVDVPEATIYAGTVKTAAKTIAELIYPHVVEEEK